MRLGEYWVITEDQVISSGCTQGLSVELTSIGSMQTEHQEFSTKLMMKIPTPAENSCNFFLKILAPTVSRFRKDIVCTPDSSIITLNPHNHINCALLTD
jgi:hypothetical protein